VATIGLLHPGEMGSALGAALRAAGHDVLWASAGRSAATGRRAEEARLRDVETVAALSRDADVIISVCPPHAATEVASSVSGFQGLFVDANAVAPATARTIGAVLERFVDGGIIGPPPHAAGTTRLYLSGAAAGEIGELFAGTIVETRVVSDDPGAASAVKMAYAAWTKGTAALLLAIRALARAELVEDPLLEEWRQSLPELLDDSSRAARSAARKGWRWVAEMEEIAATFASADLPDGFHRAAAEIFRRSPRLDEATLAEVLSALRARAPAS
jgi:3-hydroxyisobutyrate dehydrogenase-like beta-hydroxyacid dehydrogenase